MQFINTISAIFSAIGALRHPLAAAPASVPDPAPVVAEAPPVPDSSPVAVTPVQPPSLTVDREAAIKKAADSLGLSVARFKAVTDTESGGKYSWGNGKIPILVERHKVYQHIAQNHGVDAASTAFMSDPDIVNPASGGYGKYSEQYGKLARLIAMGYKTEAYLGTSFGAFQILGENYEACGFDDVITYVDAMHAEPQDINQINAFAQFLIGFEGGAALRALQRADYAEFARRYNGPAYQRNRYDSKIASAEQAEEAA